MLPRPLRRASSREAGLASRQRDTDDPIVPQRTGAHARNRTASLAAVLLISTFVSSLLFWTTSHFLRLPHNRASVRIDASGGSYDTAGGYQFDDGYWDDFRYGAGFNHEAFSGAQDPIPTPDPDPHDSGQATTTPTTSTSSSSTSTTIWSRLLGGMSSGGASGAGEGGGLDLTWAGGWKRKRLDRDAAAPPPLDSCRRCEAFSAADLAADAPDGSLRVQDPDWQLQQTSYARGAAWLLSVVGDDEQGHERGAGPGAASGDSGGRAKGKGEEEHGVGGPWPKEEGAWPRAGAGAGPQEDVRRRACRAIGPYLDQIPYDRTLREHHHRVVRYIRSPEYRARAAAIAAAGTSGILISAGGPRYTASLAASLHVLRRHLGCTLPIEVAWQGPAEMDGVTWAALQRHFGPLRGFDVTVAPHPVPELHGRLDIRSTTGKVYALLQSNFTQVLMLDADSLPLMEPQQLFEDPRFVRYGSLLWPDAWTGKVHRDAFELYGMEYGRATAVLDMGLGTGRRNAESGQLLLDRGRHLDVLEMLMLINRSPVANSGVMWGDKDTFSLAFAMAGKAHCYNQVAVPPSGFFHWSPDRLLHKTTKQQGPGWLLGGFVQNLEDQPYVYGVTKLHVVKAPGDGSGADGVSNVTAAKGTAGGGGGGLKGLAAGLEGLALSSDAARIAANMNAKRRQRLLLDAKSANVGAGVKGGEAATERQGQQNGRQAQQQQQPLAPPLVALGGGVRPAFLHRTMDKFAVGEAPHLMEVLTAPMTQSWANYYLAHDNPGPTRGVPWDYAVPASALDLAVTRPRLVWLPGGSNGSASTDSHGPGIGRGAAFPLPLLTGEWLQQLVGAGGRGRGTGRGPGRGRRTGRGSRGEEEADAWALAWGAEGEGDEEEAEQGGGWWGRLWGRKPSPGPEQGVDEEGAQRGEELEEGAGPGSTPWWQRPSCRLQADAAPGGREGLGHGAGAALVCPKEQADAYLQAVDSGLALDRHPALEQACANHLMAAAAVAAQRVAAAAEGALAAGRTPGNGSGSGTAAFNSSSSEAKQQAGSAELDLGLTAYVYARDHGLLDVVPLPRTAAAPYAYLEDVEAHGGGLGLLRGRQESGGQGAAVGGVSGADGGAGGGKAGAREYAAPPPPLPALRQDWQNPWPCADAPFASVVRATYRAYGWVRLNAKQFPLLVKGSERKKGTT